MAGTFSNPVQAQSGTIPSMQPMSTNNAGAVLAQGLADIADVFVRREEAARKAAIPSQSEIDKGETDAGRKLALQRVAEYDRIVQTQGREAANRWRRKVSLQDQSNLYGKSIDGYVDTWGNMVGGSALKAEEEAYQEAHAQEIKAAAARKTNRIETGRMFASMTPNLSEEPLTEDQLERIGFFYESQKEQMDFKRKQGDLYLQELNIQRNERQLISEEIFDSTVVGINATVQSMLAEYQGIVSRDPSQSPQAKATVIGELTAMRASIDRDLALEMQKIGGSLSDVPPERLNGVRNQIDNYIALIRGDYGVELNETTMRLMTSGAALDYLSIDTNSKMAVVAGINSYAPGTMTTSSGIGAVDPTRSRSQLDVIFQNIEFQVAPAIAQANLSPEDTRKVYTDTGKALVLLSATDKPENKQSAANTLVTAIWEGAMGNRKARSVALGKNGVINMINESVKMGRGAISSEIQAAAEAEGMTPEELFATYSSRFTRDVIVPSLKGVDSTLIEYMRPAQQGSKLVLELDVDGYIAATMPKSTPGGLGVSEVSHEVRIRNFDKSRKKAEAEINKLISSYAHIMNATEEDAAYVLSLVLKDTFTILQGSQAVTQELIERNKPQ